MSHVSNLTKEVTINTRNRFKQMILNHTVVDLFARFELKAFSTFVKDYIEFRHGRGCYSLIGRKGSRQEINFSPYCAEEHTLIHEVRLITAKILNHNKTAVNTTPKQTYN